MYYLFSIFNSLTGDLEYGITQHKYIIWQRYSEIQLPYQKKLTPIQTALKSGIDEKHITIAILESAESRKELYYKTPKYEIKPFIPGFDNVGMAQNILAYFWEFGFRENEILTKQDLEVFCTFVHLEYGMIMSWNKIVRRLKQNGVLVPIYKNSKRHYVIDYTTRSKNVWKIYTREDMKDRGEKR